jgi:hypothetical protein
MEAFRILDCEILWNKQNNIPKSHLKAIKEELKTMAPQISNALKFTTENRGSMVTYEVKPKIKTEWFYGITIFSGIDDLRQDFLKILVQGGTSAQNFTDLAYINNNEFKITSASPNELLQLDSFSK